MTAAIYDPSHIKRNRATKAEVEARREALLDIIDDGKPRPPRGRPPATKPSGTPTATTKIHTYDATPERRRAARRPRAEAAVPAGSSS